MEANNLGDNSKPREDEDVNFRVSKKSKQMLVENWVPPASRIKKRCVEITV